MFVSNRRRRTVQSRTLPGYATGLAFLQLMDVSLARSSETRVGWSALVPECRRCPRKDVLLSCDFIVFSILAKLRGLYCCHVRSCYYTCIECFVTYFVSMLIIIQNLTCRKLIQPNPECRFCVTDVYGIFYAVVILKPKDCIICERFYIE